MAGNPRIVTADVAFIWDGGEQRLRRGTIIDVPAGSVLEEAIGAQNLVPLRPEAAPPAQPAPPVQAAPAAPAAAKVTAPQPPASSRRSVPQDAAKDSSDEKEGHS